MRFAPHIATLAVSALLAAAGTVPAAAAATPDAAVSAALPAQVGSAADFAQLRQTWQVSLTGGSGYDPTEPAIAARVADITTLAQDYWDDMDTTAGRTYLWADLGAVSTTAAQKTSTYTRLAAMALAYATTGSALEGDTGLADDISGALQWLYDHAYNESMSAAGNWWDWQIGVPQKLLDIVVLLDDQLTLAQRQTFLKPVQKFPKLSGTTGANRVWIAGVIAQTGALLDDGTALTTGRDALSAVLPDVESGDGFYADGSFIQHTYIPYTGGYGVALLNDLSALIVWLSDSPWAVTDPAVANVVRWVYDSFEPLMHDGLLMDMVRGREISRSYTTDHVKGHAVISAVMLAAELAPAADAAAFRGMVKAWIQDDTYRDFLGTAPLPDVVEALTILDDPAVVARVAPDGYRQFAAMDRAVQRRPDYAVGISMSSDRVATYEATNSEDLRGWYTAEGMTYLYNADLGQYSDDYWPTVDPYRLAGTTVDTATRADGSGALYRSSQREAGGTSVLGLYGTSAMKVRGYSSSLTAKKSWFTFDDEVVALGAGITSTDGRDVQTTVENRKLTGDADQLLTVDGQAEPTTPGWSAQLTDVTTAHLEGNVPGADIGYYFPSGATLNGLRESRTGAWSDIDGRATALTDPVTASYATLWIDHGTNPAGATYDYALLPGASATEVEAYASAPDFTVLANTASVQAVREDKLGITAAQFWAAASSPVGGIRASARSAVMTAPVAGGLTLSVSDPSQHATGPIEVELDQAATSVEDVGPEVTVTQLSPTIKVLVDTSGGQTATATFRTDPPTAVPAAPVLRESTTADGAVTLSWDPVAQASGYTVRYWTSPGVDEQTAEVAGSSSYTLPAVTWGQTYSFTVTAHNALGSGPASAQGTVKALYVRDVDDSDTADVTVVGDWAPGAGTGFVGPRYLHDRNAGKGTKSVSFTPDLAAGTYRVSLAWVANANRATNVPVTVDHADGSATVVVNQTQAGGQWNELGVFTFDSGGTQGVTIATTGTNGYVVADGVRFERVTG